MRMFLAIDLPAAVRSALGDATARLRDRYAGWRWLRPDGIHLTVRFLGEVDPAGLDHHARTWERVARTLAPGRVGVGGAGVFPSRGRPRVLWVGVRDESGRAVLGSIAGGIESAAVDLGFRAETRPFRPHLTVARALREGAPEIPAPDAVGDLGPFEATEIALFRSELRPDGARYHRLRVFALGGA